MSSQIVLCVCPFGGFGYTLQRNQASQSPLVIGWHLKPFKQESILSSHPYSIRFRTCLIILNSCGPKLHLIKAHLCCWLIAIRRGHARPNRSTTLRILVGAIRDFSRRPEDWFPSCIVYESKFSGSMANGTGSWTLQVCIRYEKWCAFS